MHFYKPNKYTVFIRIIAGAITYFSRPIFPKILCQFLRNKYFEESNYSSRSVVVLIR